jgi:outer membrane receptor for ferrienterochelin and colicins
MIGQKSLPVTEIRDRLISPIFEFLKTVADSHQARNVACMGQEDRVVRISIKHFLSSLTLVLLVALTAAAQAPATGQLTGTIIDVQRALIPRATILARNDQTGAEFRTVANEVGAWQLSSVPSGSYTITVTAQGFRISTLNEIKLDAGSSSTVDATLQIGFANTLVVTASKFEEEVVNAPATASVIPEQAIRDAPIRHMADLMRTVPGMNVVQMSARSLAVTSRAATGVMPSTQLVLVDGRTAYADYLAGTYWDTVPTSIDEIKQMEVVRGPASAVWGPYAMNGVVNIVTKPPREMLGTTLTFGIGTFDRSGGAAESNRGSLYYVSGTHAQALNDRWALKIAAGFSTQDAFARPQGAIPNDFHTPYPLFPNVGATQPKVDGRVDYDFPNGKQHLAFGGGFTTGTGICYSGFGPSKADWPDRAGYGRANYSRSALNITGYVNTFDIKDTYLLFVDPAGQALQWRVKSQIYNIDFNNSHTIRAKHLISYGGNFRHMYVNAVQMPGVRRHNEGGAYFQDEMILSEHFRWVVGARMDKSDVLNGVVFSPRTTFMVKPVPGQTFRVSYNRAYVAPWTLLNYFEMSFSSSIDLGLIDPQLAGTYYYFPVHMSGNRDLKEQSMNAYEADIRQALPGTGSI